MAKELDLTEFGGAPQLDLSEFETVEPEQDNPLKRGWNKMKQSVGLTSDLATGNYGGAAQRMADMDNYQRKNPGSVEGQELMQAWNKGDGIVGGLGAVGDEFSKDWNASDSAFGKMRSVGRNLSAMGAGVIEQTPNMLAPMAGMLAGGAAGSLASPVVGTAIGGWAGASLGNTAVEGGGMAQDALQKAGINPQDKAATRAYLEQNGDKILTEAGIKGSIIGAVDTATMGLGHALLSAPAKAAAGRAAAAGIDITDKVALKAAMQADPIYQAAGKGAGNLARNTGVAALEPIGEGVGEYVGQGVATGDWNEKNAFLEAASSIGQSGATFAGQKLYQGVKYPFANQQPPDTTIPGSPPAQQQGTQPAGGQPPLAGAPAGTTTSADGTTIDPSNQDAPITPPGTSPATTLSPYGTNDKGEFPGGPRADSDVPERWKTQGVYRNDVPDYIGDKIVKAFYSGDVELAQKLADQLPDPQDDWDYRYYDGVRLDPAVVGGLRHVDELTVRGMPLSMWQNDVSVYKSTAPKRTELASPTTQEPTTPTGDALFVDYDSDGLSRIIEQHKDENPDLAQRAAAELDRRAAEDAAVGMVDLSNATDETLDSFLQPVTSPDGQVDPEAAQWANAAAQEKARRAALNPLSNVNDVDLLTKLAAEPTPDGASAAQRLDEIAANAQKDAEVAARHNLEVAATADPVTAGQNAAINQVASTVGQQGAGPIAQAAIKSIQIGASNATPDVASHIDQAVQTQQAAQAALAAADAQKQAAPVAFAPPQPVPEPAAPVADPVQFAWDTMGAQQRAEIAAKQQGLGKKDGSLNFRGTNLVLKNWDELSPKQRDIVSNALSKQETPPAVGQTAGEPTNGQEQKAAETTEVLTPTGAIPSDAQPLAASATTVQAPDSVPAAAINQQEANDGTQAEETFSKIQGRAQAEAAGAAVTPIAQGRPQPTKLGTQTTANAGPGFDAANVGAMLPASAKPVAAESPKQDGFDSKAWDKQRSDTIKASKQSGATHLDSVTPSVESMRGKVIYSVHDPKEKGVIRTVDNNGNVYVQWSDEYSGGKNSASETEEPNKIWLGASKSLPIWKKQNGKQTMVLQTTLGANDLQDYAFGPGGTYTSGMRANQALNTLGLKDTHAAVQRDDGKWVLQAKAEQSAQNQPVAPVEQAQIATNNVASKQIGRDGYDTQIEVDASQLKTFIEATRGEPLVNKPEKLEAWRNGTARTDVSKFPIEVGFNSRGNLDVNDGRHRIALAAERGEKVKVFIDGADASKLKSVLSQPNNTPTASDASAPQAKAQAVISTSETTAAAAENVNDGDVIARYGDGKGGGLGEIAAKIAASKARKSHPNDVVTIEDAGYALSNGKQAFVVTVRAAPKVTGPAQSASDQPQAQAQAAQPVSGTPVAPESAPPGVAKQPTQVAIAPKIIGERIDKTWTAFHPESGTLNVPRADMPQIKSEHRGAMINFLNARGIEGASEVVPAESLKPTQAEFAKSKVEQSIEFNGSDRPVLVSSDNHVLDGHHQWLGKLGKGEPVKITRLNAPITQLLKEMREFPSAGMTKDAGQLSTPVSFEASAPAGVAATPAPAASDTAPAPAAQSPLRVGRTPKDTEPVSVIGGVVHIGKYPAVSFEGEDVTVPEGASDAQIKQALIDAKALGSHSKIFGGSTTGIKPATAPQGNGDVVDAAVMQFKPDNAIIRGALNKPVKGIEGTTTPIKTFVYNAVQAGATVQTKAGQRVLEMKDGGEFTEAQLTKPGMDFAEYLVREQAPAQAQPAPVAPAAASDSHADGKTRAVAGGQIGVNGFEYKGGQFLPSTQLPPGTFRAKDGKIKQGNKGELIEPGKFENPPTPTSRSVYTLLAPGYFTVWKDGNPIFGNNVRGHDGTPITLDTAITPGVKGVRFDSTYTIQELIDLYNRGARWLELDKSAPAASEAPVQPAASPSKTQEVDDALSEQIAPIEPNRGISEATVKAQYRTAKYWLDNVVGVLENYFEAYRAMGAERLERSRIKPDGLSATEWIEKLRKQESSWDRGRKTGLTGTQLLSQKGLWPTVDGKGEVLRKSMLAVIGAIRKSPGSNVAWMQMQEERQGKIELGDIFSASDTPSSNPIAPVGQSVSKQADAGPVAPAAEAQAPQAATTSTTTAKKRQGFRAVRSAAYDKNTLMTFLARHGMYHVKDKPGSLKKEFSPDRPIMVGGYGPVFRRTGLLIDGLLPLAIQDGYLPAGSNESQMYDLIARAVSGEKISPVYADGVAEQLMQEQLDSMSSFEDFMDSDITPSDLGYFDEDFDVPGYAQASDAIKSEVNALLVQAEALEIDTDSIKEDAARATESQPEQAYYEAARAALQAAIQSSVAASDRPGSQNPGQAGDAASQAVAPPDAPVLAAPSRQDVLAQQQRANDAERLDEQQRIDRETRQQLLNQQNAPEQRRDNSGDMFELEKAQAEIDARNNSGTDQAAQDAQSGQSGMFDEPVAPVAAPAAAQPSAEELRAQADLMNALADLGDILSAPFRANLTQEQEQRLFPVLTRVMDAAIRLGYAKFKDAAKFALDKIRAVLGNEAADALTLDHFQGSYIATASGKPGTDTKRAVIDVADKAEIEAHTAQTDKQRQEANNVPSAAGNLERNSREPAPEPTVGDAVSADGSGADGSDGQAGVPAAGSQGDGLDRGISLSTGSAAAPGEHGDQRVPRNDESSGAAGSAAGTQFGERGSDVGIIGVPPESIPASAVDAVAEKPTGKLKQVIENNRAEKTPQVSALLQSIRDTLPQLLPHQQEDVQKAETRFAVPDGYGMLFTNGTGTGKTFLALGVIKRNVLQGKTNTLILVPDPKIMADWIAAGKRLNLDITPLKNTKDAGKGIVITTYSNMGANDAVAGREWELVVTDEAHSLTQGKDGDATAALTNLRAVSHHPDGVYQLHQMRHRAEYERIAEIGKTLRGNASIMSNADTMDEMVAALRKENNRLYDEDSALRQKMDASLKALRADHDARQGPGRTRLLALSATPFAYEKSIDWANGYLFDYKTDYFGDETDLAYNQPNAKQKYFMTRFGWSMRTNKLNAPDAKIDSGLLQRQWNTELKRAGSLSGRMLDVNFDYDRRFVSVQSEIGNRIDEALEWLSDKLADAPKGDYGFSSLYDRIKAQFDYQSKRYLLEAIKAKEAIPIIKQHLAMGRKVVVFHDFKKGGGINPFNVSLPKLTDDSTPSIRQYHAAATEFLSEFSDLASSDMGRLLAPIELFRRELPKTLIVNGDEKPADNLRRFSLFQDDASGPQVMLVQSAKNKGWSGHDTTGKHQRVLINLGLPTAPTVAIQQEGRIYRQGQASNAIIRYFNTGTAWERWAFASTIAARADAAEGLGMGESARALRDAFIDAFNESDAHPPGHEGEGAGGKERDATANAAITEYDRAKTMYWAQQKKNSRTKAQEGDDYYATPEPLGLKMVQWLDTREGESVLEPSAGHGAIARWLPSTASRTVIEPSLQLRSRLGLVMNPEDDRILSGRFEDLDVTNKFDGIVMNPPFGTGGKTAIEHLAKAATHLRHGGRIVALIPTGPAADAKFDKWFYETKEVKARSLATIIVNHRDAPLYAGDTVTYADFMGVKQTMVVASVSTAGPMQKFAYGTNGEKITTDFITNISPTGARTKTETALKDIHLVADIKLPGVTFERAGTAVNTRVVVLERANTPPQTIKRDLTQETDITGLFNALEDMRLPARTEPTAPVAEQKTKPKPEANKPVEAPKPKVGDTISIGGKNYEVQIYTTNGGKEMRGVWMDTEAEARKIGGKRTFTKYSGPLKGKWFVYESNFPKDAVIQDLPAPSNTFSTRESAPTTPLTVQATQALVTQALARTKGAVNVRVVASPDAIGVAAPDGTVASGMVDADGNITIFANGVGNAADVERVVFHELFHRGLQNTLAKSDYAATLLGMAKAEAIVQQAADAWKASKAGIAKLAALSKAGALTPEAQTDYDALAVEEGLAKIAESLKADRAAGTKSMRLRKLASWLARIADKFGLTKLADHIRAMTYSDAEKFVIDTIGKADATAQQGAQERFAASNKPLFRAPEVRNAAGKLLAPNGEESKLTEGQWHQVRSPEFKAFFGDWENDPDNASKVIDSVTKEPMVVYHGTEADVNTFNVGYAKYPGFTSNKNLANTYGSNVIAAYLNIKSPSVVDAKGRNMLSAISNITDGDIDSPEMYLTMVVPFKNDGLFVSNVSDPTLRIGRDNYVSVVKEVIFPKKNTQIKSATNNNGNFDPANPDIRFSTTDADQATGFYSEKAADGVPMFSRQAPAKTAAENRRAFMQGSKIVNPDGTPKIMYHGTARDITKFAPKQADAIFLTDNPEFAAGFAGMSEWWMIEHYEQILPSDIVEKIKTDAKNVKSDGKWGYNRALRHSILANLPTGQNIMPLIVNAQNPFDYENAEHIEALRKQGIDSKTIDDIEVGVMEGSIEGGVMESSNWRPIESKEVQAAIKAAGFDGFYVKENGVRNLAVYKSEQIKSATGNIGTYDRTNPDVRYSFAGQRAATADTHALSTAQQRLADGEDAEAVRQDTGWFKGADGKWRFEINDADAVFSEDAIFRGLEPIFSSDAGFGAVPLAEVIKHDALFSAYPDLADMRVIFAKEKPADGTRAALRNNEIWLYNAIKIPMEMDASLSSLLHEIQHGIQNIEGFAVGGSPAGMQNAYLDDKAEIERLERILTQEQDKASDEARFASDEIKIEATKYAESLGEFSESEPMQEKVKAYLLSQDRLYNEWYKKHAQLKYGRGRLDPQQRYNRLAGEVEARNTQTRQNLTDADRRAQSPESTADVKAKDVIVVFNGTEMHSAPAPANAAVTQAAPPAAASLTAIRRAIKQAYGNLLDRLESKGLVQLHQTEEDALEAAAQARADANGTTADEELAGLRESIQPSLRLWNGRVRTVNDALIPETPEYADNTTGDLAYVPQGADVPAGPLRVTVGVARGEHLGFGVNHMADNATRDARRMPARQTGDLAEDLMREAVAVMRGVASVHKHEGAYIFVNPTAKKAVVAKLTEAGVYSVISVRPYSGDVVGLWGIPDWRGRLAFPPRVVTATTPATASHQDNKPSLGRDGQAVLSEKFDFTTKTPTAPTVTYKKSRKLDIKRSADGRIQGFFDPQTGQAYLIADNTQADAAPGVLMHEVGIHMAADGSLTKLFNRAKTMTGMNKRDPFFAEVAQRMKDAGETSGEEAAAYITELYERDRANAPNAVKQWFKALLAAVKAWLFKHGAMSGESLTAADIAAVARANARSMARDLGANMGMTVAQANKAQSAGDIRYSRAASLLTGQDLPHAWQAPDATRLDDFIYSVQDKHIDTKRVLDAVEKIIGAIDDQQNPRLQEELFHGRAAKATKDFLEQKIRPLLRELRARGVKMEDLETYLHNRHAERRNIQIAKINKNMPDGGSGINTADARAYLAALTPEQNAAFKSLAAKVDAINKATRNMLVSSGLEKPETIAAWERAYGDEYVPLQREEMENGMGIGQGISVRGSASKRAMGSDKKVVDIFANIVMAHERAITRSEKKRVGEALYGLVLKAPNPDFWFAIDPALQQSPSKVMDTMMQLGNMGLDPADAESIAKEPTTRYISSVTGMVESRINPAMRNAENVLAVRINGEDKFVFFNKKDERAMRMVKALKNLDSDQLGEVMGAVSKATRYFSAINTQFNPIFGVVNIMRDFQTGMINLQSTALKGKQKAVAKHVIPALLGIYSDLRNNRAGKAATSSYAQLFEEFQREGGATGFRDMYENAQERATSIQDEINDIAAGKAKQLAKGLFGWLSDYNEAMENAVRLSAYKVAKENGMSNQQAASLAKNLTVNFNRKGQVALQAGALYAFFNASVQGTARIAQTLTTDGKLSKVGKKIIAGGLLLGAMQALLLAAAGFDDDEPPDFVRERSLVIPSPFGDKKYLSIPMPLGFHVIPGVSRIFTEWALSGGENTPKRIAQIVGMISSAMNPIGSAGMSMQTLAPTVLDPFAALTENKDWTGKPIAKLDFNSLRPTAGHTRAKDTASPWATFISKAVNYATGGDEYKPGVASPTPDQIDYLLGQISGGVGREVGKISQVVSSVATGEELPMYKTPLFGRFIGTTDGNAAESSRFYENLKKIGVHKASIDGLRKDGRGSEISGYLQENHEARLLTAATHVQDRVSNLNKLKRTLIKRDAPPEKIKEINAQITGVMTRFNEMTKQRVHK